MKQSFLEYLQNLHPSHKSKIMIVAAVITTIGMGSLWANTVRTQLTGMNTNDLMPKTGTVLSATNYITLESTEVKNNKRYLYFKVENGTDDILNFSELAEIKVALDGKEVSIESLTDRQQRQFPAKILSHTTAFGALVIGQADGEEGTVTFDNLYFETSPELIFKESMEFDYTKLKTVEELRS